MISRLSHKSTPPVTVFFDILFGNINLQHNCNGKIQIVIALSKLSKFVGHLAVIGQSALTQMAYLRLVSIEAQKV
jgi:hypothetical protein